MSATSRNPLWVDYSAHLLDVANNIAQWEAMPRHYRAELIKAVANSIRLLTRIRAQALSPALAEKYRDLYLQSHFRLDESARVYVLQDSHLEGVPPDHLCEMLNAFTTFFCEAKLHVGTIPEQHSFEPVYIAPLVVIEALSFPQLAAQWNVKKALSLVTERESYLKLVRSLYPNVPDEVSLRWGEVEQGSSLASKLAKWSKATFVAKKATIDELLTWDLSNYVSAEYTTPVPLRDIPLEQNTWARRPLTVGRKLIHGVFDYRLVRNLPNRLKVAEHHEYLEITQGTH